MPAANSVKYTNEDLDELHSSDRTRTVLTVIAAQTGVIDKPELTTDTGTADGDNSESVGREGTTTSRIRGVTGMTNDAVNYELRKLKGNTTERLTTQFIETRQQGTDDTGRQLPKLITLTDAAKQAFQHDVVNAESLATTPTPDWLPDTGTDDKIEAIAERLDQHEVVLNELMHHLGFALLTDMLDQDLTPSQYGTAAADRSDYPVLDRETLVRDPSAAPQFVDADEYTLLDALERMRVGQRALKQTLEAEVGADPSQHVDK